MKNSIIDILSEAGYDTASLSNRQRAVRSINSVMQNSEIKICIQKKGLVWINTDGVRFNVKITLKKDESSNYRSTYKLKNPNDAYTLLKCLADFLKREDIKTKILSDVSTPHSCLKCEGTGFIPQFHWYADGVCFDCMGAGIQGKLVVKLKPKKLTGWNFIQQFNVTGTYSEKFPSGVENIKPVDFINHPTAITYLGKKDDTYYIHGPICMRNDWYEIPAEQFAEFAKTWNAYKSVSI